jgi:hypothetical protein
MHSEEYGKSIIQPNHEIPQSYLDRMQFVRDEGCNSMIITGTAEPQQNMGFIADLLRANRKLRTPFYNITLQTTGSNLEDYDLAGLAELGLTTISLSISSPDPQRNAEIIGMPKKTIRNYRYIACAAKEAGLVTRASVNLSEEFDKWFPTNFWHPIRFFHWALSNHFDQITFRALYADGDSDQAKWIAAHPFPEEKLEEIRYYIQTEGTPIMRLPYGLMKYSVHGVSTVLDDDCMSKDQIDDLKYAILRPNGHLYSRWDDTGSLIF